MPKLRGMRAVVQFLRQSAESCVAPPTSPFMALLMDPWAVRAQARSRAVRLSVAAPLLLVCEAVQSPADPGLWRSDR